MPQTAPEDIEIRTPHLCLAARAWGPREGLPVMALHGWLDNAGSFDLLAPLLEKLRLIALDFPGHGHSDHRPPGVPYHHIDYVQDVFAAADGLGWDRFGLLGHSMGAGVATLAAGTDPGRVTHLGLIEGLGPLTGLPEAGPQQLFKALNQMKSLGNKKASVISSVEQAVAARQAVSTLEAAAVKLIVQRGIRRTAEGYTWRSDPRLTFLSPLRMSEEQVLAFIKAIAARTLLVSGSNGMLFDRDLLRRRADCVKHLETVTLEGGHHLHLEHPRAVASCLRPLFNAPEVCSRAPSILES